MGRRRFLFSVAAFLLPCSALILDIPRLFRTTFSPSFLPSSSIILLRFLVVFVWSVQSRLSLSWGELFLPSHSFLLSSKMFSFRWVLSLLLDSVDYYGTRLMSATELDWRRWSILLCIKLCERKIVFSSHFSHGNSFSSSSSFGILN